jgi:hypothetical protein
MQKKWTSGLYGRLRRGGQGGARAVDICRSLFLIFASISFVRGTHTPRIAHSARWGWRISFVWASRRGDSRFPLSFVVYILLRSEGTINEIQTKPKTKPIDAGERSQTCTGPSEFYLPHHSEKAVDGPWPRHRCFHVCFRMQTKKEAVTKETFNKRDRPRH